MSSLWDGTGIETDTRLWRECLRVLKPGGHCLAFGSPRTWHNLQTAIEKSGFEIRDSIAWLYGSGFPKSLDVSKAIDKAAGAEREVIGRKGGRYAYGFSEDARDHFKPYGDGGFTADPSTIGDITAPATPAAQQWDGWGTALKPAFEPIVVARKPLAGTVASNVLAHGTGALNVDGCRVGAGLFVPGGGGNLPSGGIMGRKNSGKPSTAGHTSGRWPANVVLGHTPDCDVIYEGRGEIRLEGPCAPGCPVAELDRQSGESSSRVGKPRGAASGDGGGMTATGAEYADSGGASRFFYTTKAPSAERPKANGIAHPTVKPLDLMRWLVRLVTPPGGVVLDPFAGSGTTLEAAIVEGFRSIGIEREADYLPLIEQRIARACPPLDFGEATA